MVDFDERRVAFAAVFQISLHYAHNAKWLALILNSALR
jgi:hypothetical protein